MITFIASLQGLVEHAAHNFWINRFLHFVNLNNTAIATHCSLQKLLHEVLLVSISRLV